MSIYKEIFKKAWEEVKELEIPKIIRSAGDVVPLLSDMAELDHEEFYVVLLNGAHKVIAVEQVSKGIVNRCIVHPREIFRKAIQLNAVGIILAHNHPSGELDPSPEDLEITKRLLDSSEIIGINIIDHLIIGEKGFNSILQEAKDS